MPEALFCMWLKPDGFIVTTGQQPWNPHLGAGPEVPAYRLPFSTEAIEFNSDVSEQVEEIVLHALALDPSAKYSSAAAESGVRFSRNRARDRDLPKSA